MAGQHLSTCTGEYQHQVFVHWVLSLGANCFASVLCHAAIVLCMHAKLLM
jgi:hypothetical protein